MHEPNQQTQAPIAEPAPSVHPKETSVIDGVTMTYRDRLLRFNREELIAVEQTYSLIDIGSEKKTLQRLDDCRTSAYFAFQETTKKVVVLSSSCKLRWCPMCAKARASCITKSVTAWLARCHSPKMLTVTLRHSSAPLAHQLNYLYAAWRRFRQRKLLHKKVRGGIWFFQLKWSEEAQEWHPHIHALIEASYIPQASLSALWLDVTKHSQIVDIRQVKDPGKTAAYVARYAARPVLLSHVPFEKRTEVVTAFHGRRIVGTWGTARSVSLRPQSASVTGPWYSLDSFENTLEHASTDSVALSVLQAWRQGTPLPESSVAWFRHRDYPPIVCASALDSPPDPQYTFSDLHPPPQTGSG